MIIRRGVFPFIHRKLCSCRSISVSTFKLNEDRRKNLPSRKLFESLTEKKYMDEQLSRSGRRPFEVMVENPIVVKHFFVSNIEDDNIIYPEVVSTSELDNWKKTNAKIAEYFNKQIQYSENGFKPSVYKAFRKMNLFNYNVPKTFGGQQLSYTHQIFRSETETQNLDAAIALSAHRLFCNAITEIGTDQQCDELLPKLATGELIGTLAFKEWNNAFKVDLNTQAEFDDEEEVWCLNGKKSFVANAADANLFLVTARTEISDRKGDMKDTLTVFIVDSKLPGVKVHKKDKTIGHPNLYQSSVSFDDVKLSKDKVLSIPGAGDYIQQRLQIHSRLSEGLLNLSQMKCILHYIMGMAASVEKVTMSENEGTEAKTLRHVIGKYTCSIYSLESMLYLTTGIMDKHENTNIDLETAIFKTYSQDQLLDMTIDLMSFVDARVTLNDHPLNQFVTNAIQLKFSEPTNELKLHIGNQGIQYRMSRLIEEVSINKNKTFIIKNFLTPEQLELYEPALRPAAKCIHESIQLLRLGVSVLFEKEVRDLPKRQIEITKLADASACIYASFACLLRSNQSMKLKLPNALDEIAIAQTICDRNITEVTALMKYIEEGPIKTFSQYHEFVTELLLKKQYDFPAHPLSRYF